MFQRAPFLLALFALLSVGCTPRGSRGGRGNTTDDDDTTAGDDDDLFADDDDDTTAGDDDDTTAGDDDDTVVTDDDDTVVTDDDDTAAAFDFNQIQFSFTVDAGAPDASGDHDLSAVFFFTYVVADQAAGTSELTCNQRVEVEGTGIYGFGQVPNCSNCTGLMTFDPSTAVDTSDPATNADDCDPQFLIDNNVSIGLAMLHPFGSNPGYWPTADGGEENFGDFLNIATMDSNTQQSLGWDGSATGQVDLTAAGNADWATNTYGAEYTHAGLVDGSSGANTLAAQSGIDGVANAAGPGSDYYFYFTIARDPNVNSYVGQDMQGAYFGFARFVITFGG